MLTAEVQDVLRVSRMIGTRELQGEDSAVALSPRELKQMLTLAAPNVDLRQEGEIMTVGSSSIACGKRTSSVCESHDGGDLHHEGAVAMMGSKITSLGLSLGSCCR